jgi:hypothetical protein
MSKPTEHKAPHKQQRVPLPAKLVVGAIAGNAPPPTSLIQLTIIQYSFHKKKLFVVPTRLITSHVILYVLLLFLFIFIYLFY